MQHLNDSSIPARNEHHHGDNDDDESQGIDLFDLLNRIVEGNKKQAQRMEYSINLQERILDKLTQMEKISSLSIAAGGDDNANKHVQFTPIDTIEDIVDFEDKLKSDEFDQQMVILPFHAFLSFLQINIFYLYNSKFTQLQPICSEASGLRGDKVCYKFVDGLFTRRFFDLVSWTGTSRSGQIKENFSRFARTFGFFLKLVNSCDSAYTGAKTKNFFRKVIDNSKRRLEFNQNPSIAKKPRLSNNIYLSRTNSSIDVHGDAKTGSNMGPIGNNQHRSAVSAAQKVDAAINADDEVRTPTPIQNLDKNAEIEAFVDQLMAKARKKIQDNK